MSACFVFKHLIWPSWSHLSTAMKRRKITTPPQIGEIWTDIVRLLIRRAGSWRGLNGQPIRHHTVSPAVSQENATCNNHVMTMIDRSLE